MFTENFPIEVVVKKGWNGKYFVIEVEPFLMTYDTFLKLGDNLTSEAIEYGKKSYGVAYDKNVELYSNDVGNSTYDYNDYSCTFNCSTQKDVDNWLELYKEFVKLKN